jgi:hypothetical protein
MHMDDTLDLAIRDIESIGAFRVFRGGLND